MGDWTVYIYTIHLHAQFINTAISEDVMIVKNSLESSIVEVKAPNVLVLGIFVDIPAFNYSDLAMQMKVP